MADLRFQKYQLRVNNPDAISDIDALETIQSQYAASPHMLALLVSKAALLDMGRDFMRWYIGEFNPQTAEGVGLDVWGRIVGALRRLQLEDQDILSFSTAYLQDFNHGAFWHGLMEYSAFDLSDDDFRKLIFWKAAANIGQATAAGLNEMLQKLFPGETAYVIETGVMHIRVVTRFEPDALHASAFRQYGLIGKGAGVGSEWLAVAGDVFGFAGSDLAPFNQAPFWSGHIRETQ